MHGHEARLLAVHPLDLDVVEEPVDRGAEGTEYWWQRTVAFLRFQVSLIQTAAT